MKVIIKLFKKLILLGILVLILISGTIFYFLWKFSPELPSYADLKDYNPNLASRVFTSDGLLFDQYYNEERIFVPFERMPNHLVEAFISAEDKNYFKHIGIDFKAIFRATLTNIYNYFQNKRLIGASTITQQVVKNLLLTNEVSFERKFKELILALRIEKILNKEQILELYLNDIYLGFGSYGVASASLNYFNKDINNLNIEEVAFLAALPKAPNNYNPKNKYIKAIERRNWVLDKMYKNQFISRDQLLLKSRPIIISKRDEDKFEEADYYKEEIRKRLIFLLGNDALYKKGLVIKTSIDTKYQKILDNVLFNGLIAQDKKNGWRGVISNDPIFKFDKLNKEIKNPFPHKWEIYLVQDVLDKKIIIRNKINEIRSLFLDSINNNWLIDEKFYKDDILFIENIKGELVIRQIPQVNGAMIAIDPHSGKVLALSGGFSFNLSQFNRATQAKRQPGSAFKPFVYITALKEGYNPSTLVLDAPYVVDQGPGLPKWKPSNYSDKFYGLNTIRTGIEKSRNLMTIRLSDKIGMNKILQTARDFRIDKYMDENLSMSLGAGLVSLIDITNAYAMIVNGGKVIKPTLILSVSDKNGKQIINNENKICDSCMQNNQKLDYEIPQILNNQEIILDDRIAYQITSMLNGVVLRGTGKKISSLNTPIAGKTGTTNGNKDAWFIGFSPDIAVGVYIGHDNPKSLGYGQTGSEVAVPIFKNFMKEANININKTPFRIPSGLSFVKIDPKSGLPTSDLNGILEAFILGTEPYNRDNIKKLDNLSTINNNSISGTGSLLNE